MIFPTIETEDVVQINDKFRILADKSFKTPDVGAWTAVEIDPGDGSGFISIAGDLTKPNPEKKWFLDYQYSTAGVKTITLKITCGLVIAQATAQITVLTVAQDNLFSTDQELRELQEDVMRLLPDGRSSFKYKHRAAQNFILDWLWNNGYAKQIGSGLQPFTKSDIIDKKFISDWSTYVCLRMIYEANQSQIADVFRQKAGDFLNAEERAREKFLLSIDVDGDSTLSENEGVQISSRRLVRV